LETVALGMAAVRPLHAQAAPDTTLASAVATVLADSLLDRLTSGPLLWQPNTGWIDLAVANALRTHPKFRGPVRDPRHMLWVGIRHVEEHGDTARVIVESGQQYRDTGTFTFYVDSRAYLFIRAKEGWRFVRSRYLEHADGGFVRG